MSFKFEFEFRRRYLLDGYLLTGKELCLLFRFFDRVLPSSFEEWSSWHNIQNTEYDKKTCQYHSTGQISIGAWKEIEKLSRQK
ncbi:MAG: hypothetical protein LBQ66_00470 [Planctomycetaceae bacterium]|jgi:hypothetical protein|nr:hypothetical protein [Planctomycetaceae bacterium]